MKFLYLPMLTKMFERRRILREGAYVVLGQASVAFSAIIAIRILTGLLVPSEFGRLSLLLGVSALITGLTATPRLQAIIRYYPGCKDAGEIALLRQIGIRLVGRLLAVAALLSLLAWFIFGKILDLSPLSGIIIAVLVVVDCSRSFELALFNAARRQKAAALVGSADAWVRLALAAAGVLVFGPTAEAALAGYGAGSAFVLVVMRLTTRVEGDKRAERRSPATAMPLASASLARDIRRYSLPLAPLAIFGWLSGVGDRYIIAGLLSVGQAGLYAAMYGLASRPFLMLAAVVELTMRPVLQNAVAAGQSELVAKTKRAWLLATGGGAAIGVASYALLSGVVADIFLAKEYRGTAALMPIIALGYGLYVISNVYSRFCYTFDDTRAVLLLTTVGSIVSVGALFPLTASYGLSGAAAAVPLGFGLQLGLSVAFARRAEINRREPGEGRA